MPTQHFHGLWMLALASTALIVGTPVTADPPKQAEQADALYVKAVQPILNQHCVSCHGGTTASGKVKIKGELDLTSKAKLLEGGSSGSVVEPGQPSKSLLIQLVHASGQPHMPPTGQLSADEIATLAKWIEQLPTSSRAKGKVISDEDRRHWAFQPLTKPPIPSVQGRTANPIDAFILKELEQRGLTLAPPASKRDLIRRAYFDLIGLPPTPEEVEAFVADRSPDAYERLLDRLLASPHYGERWGRHWLDLARYAESSGFGDDRPRNHAWRYRDYVIERFNQDVPYAQFVREQLAGDEYSPDDPAAIIATGFGRNGPTVDAIRVQEVEKYRLEELDDVISTTGVVFMGLTVGCAKCHDHKYDPITQLDYYRLMAIFNSTVRAEVPLNAAGRPDWPGLLAALEKASKAPPPAVVLAPTGKENEIMALVETSNRPRQTHLLVRGDFRNRGPEVSPGVPEVLAPRPLTFPQPAANARSTGQRKAFADWLVAPENALTYRVMTNRIWQYHFGRGIVASSSNFGLSGDRPTHPELLEWLTGEFLRGEGRLKALHKLIMTSETYKQASTWREDAAQLDPDNLWLWRFPKRRLEAEPIRDSILAVSGKLNLKMGGPSIKPRIHPALLNGSGNVWPTVAKEGPEHWRRSVYVFVKRSLALPFLELFDAPSPSASCERRVESTVATQALLMVNGDFVNEQARFFAERVQREAGANPAKQIERAYRLAYSRLPTADESQELSLFMERFRQMHRQAGRPTQEVERLALIDLCQVLFASNEFVYID